jgi:uncharacterized protein (UPF0276 family)
MSLQGTGIGLRSCHYRRILDEKPSVDWLEVLVDNYMGYGGQPLYYLEKISRHYPLSFHGVGLSLGSAEPLNREYIGKLKDLINRFDPVLVSDHLCWSALGGVQSHDLLPLPFSMENARYLAAKILQVQDLLGRRILVENVSSYLEYAEDAMAEWEFLCEILRLADCNVLCDVNNIYVSACNHDFNPALYLAALPVARVSEFHLAGHSDQGTHLLDTHGSRVCDDVWDLYRQALERFGRVPTLVEWDTDIPELPVLLAEADKARKISDGFL